MGMTLVMVAMYSASLRNRISTPASLPSPKQTAGAPLSAMFDTPVWLHPSDTFHHSGIVHRIAHSSVRFTLSKEKFLVRDQTTNY